jgi:outer membrane protein, multidrug efflux system
MKITNIKMLLGPGLGLLVLAGCTNLPSVGPNYHQPNVSTPAQWGEPLAGGETNAATAVAAWWNNFNDPELNSLVDRAVQSNLDLRVAQARVRVARAQYGSAVGNLGPTVGASGSYARERQSENQPLLGSLPIPPGVPFENNVYQSGFDASWEIDVFGGQRRAVEAAKDQVAAAEYDRRATLLTLLGDVTRTYLDVRGDQRRLAIAQENIAAQEQSLAIAQDRFTNGLTGNLDVQEAATLLATTRAEVPALESSLQASIHQLGVLLGQPPETLLTELSQSAPIPPAPPVVPVGLPSELLKRRPDVQEAERQLAAATANIGVAEADLFPKFSLTGQAGLESVSASDFFTPGSRLWSIGPTVQWQIFDSGRIYANIKVQNARQEEALATYQNTVLNAFEDVENSLVSYAKEQTRRRELQDAVTSSQASLELSQKLYRNGLTDFLNVLNAESSLYQAQDALVQSDESVSTDVVALYKSLGGGWQVQQQQLAGKSDNSQQRTP